MSVLDTQGSARLKSQLEDMDALEATHQTINGKKIWAQNRLVAWFAGVYPGFCSVHSTA